MADPKPFLSIWSVVPAQVGEIQAGQFSPTATPRQYDVCFQAIPPHTDKRLRIYDHASSAFLTPASEGPFDATQSVEAITIIGVTRFLFHRDGDVAGIPDFGAPVIPQSIIEPAAYARRLPFQADVADVNGHGRRAHDRLSQTVAAPFSMVRLTQLSQAEFPQWLMFRFPLRAPVIGDMTGGGGAAEVGALAGGLLRQVAANGNDQSPDEISKVLLQDAASAAELRDGAFRRAPYLAGVFACAARNAAPHLEAFASNASAVGVLAAIGAVDGRNSPARHWSPFETDRLDKATAMADGLWWAHSDKAGNQARTLATNLRQMSRFPISGGDRPVLTALFSEHAKAPKEAFAPRLAVLEVLGLTPAATTPPDREAAQRSLAVPQHYLHTRQVGGDLEWRRWLSLQAPGGGEPTPAMIRVRRPSGAAADPRVAAYEISVEGLTDAHVLDLWSRKVATPLRALSRDLGSRRSLSLLPDFLGAAPSAREKKHGGRWVVRLTCQEAWRPDRWAAKAWLTAGQVQPAWDADFVIRAEIFASATLADGCAPKDSASESQDYFYTEAPEPLATVASTLGAAGLELPALRDHYGKALRLEQEARFTIGLTDPAGANSGLIFDVGGPTWTLRAPHRLTVSQTIRGAGQSRMAVGGLDLAIGGLAALNKPFQIDIEANDDPLAYAVGDMDRPLAIAVESATVGGIDAGMADPSRQPMLWAAGPLVEKAVLNGVDRRDQLQRLRRTLFSLNHKGTAGGAGRVAVTVIDPAPMLVARVEAAKLSGATAQTSVLATWDSTESLWRLAWSDRETPTSRLSLPPQGVAEAWERRADGAADHHLPPDQVKPDARVPARLTPATVVDIESEERERNPVAPWNIGQVMGDASADLPGARLTRIERMEALYGLRASRKAIKGMRLAEMAAWRGEPPEPSGPAGRRRDDWTQAKATWDRRLAVLDLRPEDDPLARPVVDDVEFRLRLKADGAHHGRSIKASLHDAEHDQGPSDDDVWTDADKGGVIGGALAGFEQVGLVRALLRDAAGGRGSIDGLQMSALGAWTRPRSRFNNDLTRISADLQMGRTHEARFERIGRIAGLHHPAKHVIVYRRGVLPSDQFAGEQDPHVGRPIVRKAEEYIELLQPLRTYPDRVGATAMSAGWFLGARFRTIRIPVHGSWATPIDDPRFEGYALPLWKSEDELRRLNFPLHVYDRPIVEALIASDPKLTDPEPPARRVADPQKLRFYTITSVRSGDGWVDPDRDPEAWPYVYRLDMIDRPIVTPIDRPLGKPDFRSNAGPGVMLPPADALPYGLEDYTLTLEAGPLVNVSHGRNASPTLADIRTVTLLRAAPGKPDSAPDQALVAKTYANLAEASGDVDQLLRIAAAGGTPAAVKAAARKAFDALADKLPDKTALAGRGIDFKARELCAWAHEPERRLGEFLTRLDALEALLPTEKSWKDGRVSIAPLEALIARLKTFKPINQALRGQLSPAISDARAAVADLKASGEQAADDLGKAATALASRVTDLEAWITDIEALKSQVASSGPDLAETVDPLRRRGIDTAESLRGQLRAQTDRLDGLIAGLLGEIAARREAIAKAVPGGVSHFDAALKALSSASDAALKAARALDTRLGGLTFALDALADKALAAAQTEIDATRAEIVKVLGDAITALKKVDGELKTLKAMAAGVGVEAKRIVQTLASAVEAPLDEVVRGVYDLSLSMAGTIEAQLDIAIEQLSAIRTQLEAARPDYPKADIDSVKAAFKLLRENGGLAVSELKSAAEAICKPLLQADAYLSEILADANAAVAAIKARLEALTDVPTLLTELAAAGRAFGVSLNLLRQGVEDAIDGRMLKRLEAAVGPAQAASLGEAVALNLLRAAGAPPIVEQLAFNRDRIAYYFDQEAKRILVTPVTALVDQADRALKGVGLTLPTLAIEETLLAPAHAAFDKIRGEILSSVQMKASEVLKDFAGLKDMLPNLKFDSRLASGVRVTHDFDAARNTAWLQADISFGPETQDLFRQDAFALTAEKMRLQGRSRYERSLSGREARSVKASVTSDWVLEIGGIKVVRIRDAVIGYDDSAGLSFDIRPEKIEFDRLLKLFTDALAAFNSGDRPLKIEMIIDEATGRPAGLKSRYDLPPTTFGVGALTVLNASLGVHLDLVQRSEFEIRAFAYFGRRDAPFAFILGWLGGGGYLEAEATHRPSSRQTELALRLSIGACAGTGFSFGPLRGHVQVYLGFEASYVSNKAGAKLSIIAVIVISGSVTAWGFVTIGLGMRLALTYEGSRVVGRGHVSVSVRISRFYTQSFSSPINYRL
ncbi:hypothetical protein [Caulobacter sp. NIBR1757]|uniref:hypothetical protein n=1 Tax=Caulobacter sp. NIBR1757 TaxID=3016000 RepID=UPI0022F0EBDB|nr:hypothetical protein [Caulobacter sp. NIBR1757]WGM40658.1 hypothetical protein AMEJIAPC_03605 [Caulobacter sp. NIBR1757]